jgi:stress response protein YsnF
VDKQAVTYEEVEVGKRGRQDAQHVSETVRKEVVDVDAEGNLEVDGSYASNPQLDRRNA